MNAACQDRFLNFLSNLLTIKKQVVSEVMLSEEKQLLFKYTVMNRKCFIYYIISIKIIQFNLSITLLLWDTAYLFLWHCYSLYLQEIKVFSKIMQLCFSPETIPLFTKATNCIQYFLLTLQLEWTKRCTYFITYSKYNCPKTM